MLVMLLCIMVHYRLIFKCISDRVTNLIGKCLNYSNVQRYGKKTKNGSIDFSNAFEISLFGVSQEMFVYVI